MKYFITGKWKGDFGSYLISAALFYSLSSLRVHRILKRRASLSLPLPLSGYTLCVCECTHTKFRTTICSWCNSPTAPRWRVSADVLPTGTCVGLWLETKWRAVKHCFVSQLLKIAAKLAEIQQSSRSSKRKHKKKYSACTEIIDVRRWSTGGPFRSIKYRVTTSYLWAFELL